MWKSLRDLPTLTEIFFGKGVDPAKYKGSMIPAYLSGKTNGMTATKPKTAKKKATKAKTGGKSIQEVKKTAPKDAIMAKKTKKPKSTAKTKKK